MHVQVRNALADPVVDGNEGPCRLHGTLHSPADQLDAPEEAVHRRSRQVEKGLAVIPWYDEDMSVKERAAVQKGCRDFVLEDQESRLFTGYDPTEGTSLHGSRVAYALAVARAVSRSTFHVAVED